MLTTQVGINLLRYNVRGTTASAWQQIESMCNAITFTNIGTQNVTISPLGIILNPGQQFMVSGDTGELDVTQYECSFDPATGAVPALSIIRKTYV